MKKLAFLFPGQGSQFPGMGKDFFEAFSIAKETFQEADDILGFHLSRIAFEGPEAVLTETRYSQLAIFVNSIAILRTLQKETSEAAPFVSAGLSLGEYSALCASNHLDFANALRLVQVRAELMNEACEKTSGAMAAILGMSADRLEEAIKGISGVWVANYNCPGQIVISGTEQGVAEGIQALKQAGAKRALPLTVHGAFHSGLMQMAQDKLAPFLEKAPITESDSQLVMNVPGDFVSSQEEMRKYLIEQVTSSVRWEQGVRMIEAKGVDLYLEIGCGKTLTGLNKKIGVAVPTVSLEKISDLEIAVQQIEGAVCSC